MFCSKCGTKLDTSRCQKCYPKPDIQVKDLKDITDAEKCAAFDRLYKQCRDNFDHLEKEGCEMKDADHYLYETAMQAALGKDIFKLINYYN